MSSDDKWEGCYMLPVGTTLTLTPEQLKNLESDTRTMIVHPMIHSAAWISVEDKMPNEDMTALVTDGKEFIFIGEYFKETNHWGLDGTALINMDKVTHWMYLPELPNK